MIHGQKNIEFSSLSVLSCCRERSAYHRPVIRASVVFKPKIGVAKLKKIPFFALSLLAGLQRQARGVQETDTWRNCFQHREKTQITVSIKTANFQVREEPIYSKKRRKRRGE